MPRPTAPALGWRLASASSSTRDAACRASPFALPRPTLARVRAARSEDKHRVRAMRTWADVVPYLGDPADLDSSLHLSDAQVAAALAVEPTALGAAMVLSERHGKIVAAHDVRRRIQAS